MSGWWDGRLTLPGLHETAISHCSWLNASGILSPERFVSELLQSLGLAALAGKQEALTDAMESIARREGETVVFIDNIDDIEGADSHRLLERLILSAPDNLRIAFSSCSPAQLPLARLKARGVLAELTARDMEFGRPELRRLLSGSAMTALVDPIMEITRGWPALAQLAAGIVAGDPTEEERRLLLAGAHPDLTDYARETVVNRLSSTCSFDVAQLVAFSGISSGSRIRPRLQRSVGRRPSDDRDHASGHRARAEWLALASSRTSHLP